MTQLSLFNESQQDLFPEFIPDPQPIICVDPANKPEPELKTSEFELLKLIALYCGGEVGYCFAMNHHLRSAKHSPFKGKSTRTIQRALKVLSDSDLITIKFFDKARNKRRIDVTDSGYETLRQEPQTTKKPKNETKSRVAGVSRQKVSNDAGVSHINSLTNTLNSFNLQAEGKVLDKIQPQYSDLRGQSSEEIYDMYLFCKKTFGDTEKEWLDSLPMRGITVEEFESIKREWEGRKAV